MVLEKITIPKEEYNLLKIYERDAFAITKFLAINHHDIYMNLMTDKLSKIEDRLREKDEILRRKE